MKSKNEIKTIIVGVDFSSYSKIVAKQAKKMAASIGAKIVYVHIFDDIFVWDWQRSLFDKQLHKFYTHKLKDNYNPGPEDEIIVRRGFAPKHLITVAKAFPKPMIMVGHRGHSNAVAHFFLGSTAESLALASPFPVWIQRGEKIQLPKKVLVPCDLTERSLHAINETKNFKLGNAQAKYLHVTEPFLPTADYPYWQLVNDQLLQTTEQQLKEFRKKHQNLKITEAVKNDVAGEINREAKSHDLVAISPREHKRMFPSFGSVTSKVVRTGNTPVLVVP